MKRAFFIKVIKTLLSAISKEMVLNLYVCSLKHNTLCIHFRARFYLFYVLKMYCPVPWLMVFALSR